MNLGWLRAGLWWLAWIGLAALPMVIALTGSRPPARSLAVEFGALLGLLGLGVLAMQALVSGRQTWFARGFGQDDVLQFHRQTGLLALLLVFAHPLTLFIADPRFLAYLNPAENLLRAGSLGFVLVATLVLIATSLWRLSFGLRYEHWRLLHGVLAVAIVVLGFGHALMVDHYTAPMWKKAALALLVGASLYLMLETRLLRPRQMRRRPYRVQQVRKQRGDCVTLLLTPTTSERLRFRPGQFAWLTLGASPWRLQQHPFSFASSADDAELAFTIKAAGDFTARVGDVEPGAQAWLEGPYGVFTYEPGQSPAGAVFIAGGVGITPFMSMLRTARARGLREPLWLIYGSECWDEVIFREELDELAQALPLTLVHVLQEGDEAWHGETGYIDDELLDRHLPANVADLPCYVCGPEALADEVEPALRRRGVPTRRLYSERFDMV